MRFKTTIAVLAFLVSASTFGVAIYIQVVRFRHQRYGVRKPTQITYQTLEVSNIDETEHRITTYTDYTRWDGGWVRLAEQAPYTTEALHPHPAPDNPVLLIRVPNPSGSRWVGADYDPLTNNVITLDLGPAQQVRFARPLPSPSNREEHACIDALATGTETLRDFSCRNEGHRILNYPVMTARWSQLSGRMQTDVDAELAPSLNWAPLGQVIARHVDGKVFREFHAIKVVEAEPPEHLFHVLRSAKMIPQDKFWLSVGQARHERDCEKCVRPQANASYNGVEPVF